MILAVQAIPLWLAMTVGLLIVVVMIAVWAMSAHWPGFIALKSEVDARLTSTHELGLKVGDTGIALSRLAPVGTARFGHITVEAQAAIGFIDENTPVVITEVRGYNVSVTIISNS